MFVFTHSDFKSQRYTPENVADFPARFPNVTTNATPMHYRELEYGRLIDVRAR